MALPVTIDNGQQMEGIVDDVKASTPAQLIGAGLGAVLGFFGADKLKQDGLAKGAMLLGGSIVGWWAGRELTKEKTPAENADDATTKAKEEVDAAKKAAGVSGIRKRK